MRVEQSQFEQFTPTQINNRCQLPSIKQNKNKTFLFSTNRNTELCQKMNNNLAEKPKQQNSKIWKKNQKKFIFFTEATKL